MKKTFKVAISSRNILGKNGASRIILEQASRFKQSGAKVYIYASRYRNDIVPNGVQVKKFLSLNPVKEARREQFAYGFGKFCKKSNIDLSIGNGDTFDQKVMFLHNIVELELKLVHHSENYGKDSTLMLHDKILKEKRFELLIYNSKLMRDYIGNKYGISDKNSAVVYPGYDPEKFNTENRETVRKKFLKQYGIKKRHIIGFITSGNLKKRGIDIFFETLAKISKQLIDDTTFVVVGKEKNFDSYISKYKRLSGNMTYIKPVDNIEQIIKSLDVLIHPAIIEEFGMVVLESLACGVPVIASRMVGASEIFKNSLKGLALEKPNAEEFANILTKLITDKQKLKNLSQITAKTAEQYTWNSYFNTLFDMYADKRLIPKELAQKQ